MLIHDVGQKVSRDSDPTIPHVHGVYASAAMLVCALEIRYSLAFA